MALGVVAQLLLRGMTSARSKSVTSDIINKTVKERGRAETWQAINELKSAGVKVTQVFNPQTVAKNLQISPQLLIEQAKIRGRTYLSRREAINIFRNPTTEISSQSLYARKPNLSNSVELINLREDIIADIYYSNISPSAKDRSAKIIRNMDVNQLKTPGLRAIIDDIARDEYQDRFREYDLVDIVENNLLTETYGSVLTRFT
jgi:effector-binding domain-containing protein